VAAKHTVLSLRERDGVEAPCVYNSGAREECPEDSDMQRTAVFLIGSSLITALSLPRVVLADHDDDDERVERLDRDIDQDRAKIDDERRDVRRDWRRLHEEEREGDWADAERIRRDIDRDERQLRGDERDVRRDVRERRERDDDD